MLDINLISSNLIYAATIFNIENIKKQIQEVDLNYLFDWSAMIDHPDDYLLV